MRTAKITCPYCSNSQKIFYFSFNLKQFFNIFSKQEQLIPTRAITDVNKKMIYIPKGFAHGFQTLTIDCELIYHHSEFYTPNSEGGIKYNDPTIAIKWPIRMQSISERDNLHPLINQNFKGL